MAIVYSTALKTYRMQDVVDLIASKSIQASTGAGSAGSLVIGTSALSGATGVLVTIPLANPCGSVASGVLTLSGVPLSATASASGTAALAELRNNSGTVIASGLTVGTTNADIIIATTTISQNQTVQVTAGTITHG